jgi:integrase
MEGTISVKLTKRVVEATEPAGRDQYMWDAEVKGFGLKVTPAGRRVFVFQYRMGGRGTKTERHTIGEYRSPYTVDSARGEAIHLLAEVKAGRNPGDARRAERRGNPNRAQRFSEMAVEFIERHAKPNTRDWRKTEYLLRRDVLPFWSTRSAREITRRDVIELIDRVADRGARIHANRVLAALRVLFNWALSRGVIETSPAAGIKAPGAETVRERVLSEDELREVWRAADAAPYPFGPFFKLLILTAQRRDEVASMRWSEIDETRALWVIPGERAKNRRTHEVPLSRPAIDILCSTPRLDGSDLVFTTSGRAAISGFSKAKARLDRASRIGLTDRDEWRVHDIRRSVTTFMAEMGVPPHVVDKLLNHVSGSIRGVAAVYNRHGYTDERRRALDAWAQRLVAIVGDEPRSNVIALGR